MRLSWPVSRRPVRGWQRPGPAAARTDGTPSGARSTSAARASRTTRASRCFGPVRRWLGYVSVHAFTLQEAPTSGRGERSELRSGWRCAELVGECINPASLVRLRRSTGWTPGSSRCNWACGHGYGYGHGRFAIFALLILQGRQQCVAVHIVSTACPAERAR